MSIFTKIMATLVALEFFYIFYLETIATTSAATARVFKMEQTELARPSLNTLFKNQGVYNLLIGFLILVAIYLAPSTLWLGLLLGYIILVAIYGGLTSDRMIILKQGGLASVALVSLFFL